MIRVKDIDSFSDFEKIAAFHIIRDQCERFIERMNHEGYHDDDLVSDEHYLYEEVMILTLGKDIFEKVRAHNKEGRILNKQGYTVVELMAVVTSLAALSVVAFAIYAAIHFLSKW